MPLCVCVFGMSRFIADSNRSRATALLHRAGMEMQSRAGSRRFSAMTRIEALRALKECETQPKRPAEKMREKEGTKAGEGNKEREREGQKDCFAVKAGRRKDRGFLSLAVKETARDVTVPLRSPTWSTNERYGAVMDMEMHSREVTVPRRNRASEWESSGVGDMRVGATKTRYTTSPPGSKQLVLWGPTVSSSKPRLFEILVRAVRYRRSRKDFKRVVWQQSF